MSLLADILDGKRRELDRLRDLLPQAPPRTRPPLDGIALLRREPGDPLRLIAEIKRRSPSAGRLSTALPVRDRAVAYAQAGATVVSVLCDEPFFDGSWEHVREAHEALDDADVGVLAKEFVIDPVQIDAAFAFGADLVLVIARIVGDDGRLRALVDRARETGTAALVEIATDRDLERALSAGASIVGVNARDLDSLAVDVDEAARIAARVPDGIVRVHLSGLRAPGDVAGVAARGLDAALVGEALMREADPRALLIAMVRAAS